VKSFSCHMPTTARHLQLWTTLLLQKQARRRRLCWYRLIAISVNAQIQVSRSQPQPYMHFKIRRLVYSSLKSKNFTRQIGDRVSLYLSIIWFSCCCQDKVHTPTLSPNTHIFVINLIVFKSFSLRALVQSVDKNKNKLPKSIEFFIVIFHTWFYSILDLV